MSLRQVEESPLFQGSNEVIAYIFEFTDNGTPSSPTVTLTDTYDDTDVSSTKLSGSASVNGTQVTTPAVTGLTAGHTYRLNCKATVGTNQLSFFVLIIGEDV